MVGASAGYSCSNGSNNTFLGSNIAFKPRVGYYNGSIALCAGAVTNNQLMVAPNVTAFNMASFAASTGTGTGTILEFDSVGNILRTYKTVLAIDTAIATIDAPYAMSWVANYCEYTYDGSTTVQALAIWDTLNFGDSVNMATWTCPTAGL